MSKRAQTKQEQDELIGKIPADATKISVKTEKGHLKYKVLAELVDTDEIQVNKDGDPVVMKGVPGRKKNLVLAPATPVVGEILRRKKDFEDKDPILNATRNSPDDPDVLNQVVLALEKEAASLGFAREEADRNGEDTSSISIRRAKVLTAIGDTWLKRKDQVLARGIDLNSPAFQTLLLFIMQTVKESMTSAGIRDEMIETIYTKMAAVIGSPDWESDAKNKMKAVV